MTLLTLPKDIIRIIFLYCGCERTINPNLCQSYREDIINHKYNYTSLKIQKKNQNQLKDQLRQLDKIINCLNFGLSLYISHEWYNLLKSIIGINFNKIKKQKDFLIRLKQFINATLINRIFKTKFLNLKDYYGTVFKNFDCIWTDITYKSVFITLEDRKIKRSIGDIIRINNKNEIIKEFITDYPGDQPTHIITESNLRIKLLKYMSKLNPYVKSPLTSFQGILFAYFFMFIYNPKDII